MFKFLLQYAIAHRVQLLKFVVFGIATFCIYFLSFHLLYGNLHIDYKIAVSIAYVITVTSHFLLHRTFTFEATNQNVSQHVGKYLFMLGINYSSMLAIMWLLVDFFKLSPYFGLVITTITSAGMSFLVMKYFVFRQQYSLQN